MLGLDYLGTGIQNWVMTELGPLVVRGEVTMDEFRAVLVYVVGA